MTYAELKRELHADPEVVVGDGASEDQIAAAEEALGVMIPGSYRLFLGDFGWLVGYNERVFGLGDDLPADLDLVRETLAERTQFRPYLPAELIPLHNDGLGNYASLDTRVASDEPPVVLWDHEFDEDQDPFEEAKSFAAWLAELLAAARELA